MVSEGTNLSVSSRVHEGGTANSSGDPSGELQPTKPLGRAPDTEAVERVPAPNSISARSDNLHPPLLHSIQHHHAIEPLVREQTVGPFSHHDQRDGPRAAESHGGGEVGRAVDLDKVAARATNAEGAELSKLLLVLDRVLFDQESVVLLEMGGSGRSRRRRREEEAVGEGGGGGPWGGGSSGGVGIGRGGDGEEADDSGGCH